ncbi:MAG: LptF/LptG family permease [Dokdonella sp.]|nr:LptF/LptG family permease [Dokdonella sp.]
MACACSVDADGRLSALSVAAHASHDHDGWTLSQVRHALKHSRPWRGIDLCSEGPGARGSTRRCSRRHLVRRRTTWSHRELDRNIDAVAQPAGTHRRSARRGKARVFYPLGVLVLAFCALPFAFGALRSGGLSKRLFLGIIMALGFYLLQRAVINIASVYGVHPALANLLPPLILFALAVGYFRRRA